MTTSAPRPSLTTECWWPAMATSMASCTGMSKTGECQAINFFLDYGAVLMFDICHLLSEKGPFETSIFVYSMLYVLYNVVQCSVHVV